MQLIVFCAALALACTTPSLLEGQGRGSTGAPDAGKPLPSGCAMIEADLVTADSVVLSVPAPRCGDVRVELAGQPTVQRLQYAYDMVGARAIGIPVRLVNVSGHALSTPIDVRVDSAIAFHGARHRSQSLSWGFVRVETFSGRAMQQPWRFVAPSDSVGESTAGTRRARSLQPGERSGTRVFTVIDHPLTHGFRLWLDVRGVHRPPPTDRTDLPPVRPDTTPIALDRLARALIDSARLPKLRSAQALYRDSTQDLMFFAVTYGDPHDCPSGCFYSGGTGISYHGRAGWLTVPKMGAGPRFAVRPGDEYLFSQALEDALAMRFGSRNPYGDLLPLLLESPTLPRPFVRRFIDSMYEGEDQYVTRLLNNAPGLARDPRALTDLALLPGRGQAYVHSRVAAQRLRAIAPALVRDASTPAWTLFVLAQMLDQPEDSTLARLLARHPNASDSPAILTVLAEWHPALRAAAVASVRASPRIRQLLAARFAATSGTTTREYEHQLLADPEIRRNEDALLVLANMTLARDDQELVYGASHLLPEGTFRRWEWPFTPVPVRANRDGRPAAQGSR